MFEQVPLTTLMAWAWVSFAIELDNLVEATGSAHTGRLFRISIAMWANGLRLIDEDGVTVDELQARARARCNVPGLERWRWLNVGEAGPKRREGYGSSRGLKGNSVLRLTRAGAYAQRLWPAMIAEVEERWRGRFGKEVIASLSRSLGAPPGRMPWSPPEVHPSDGFYTHIVESAEPPDGHVPLVARMGQLLTALTLEQEEDAEVSLPLGANFLRVIGEDAVRTRDLPARAGVSKEAVAMALGFMKRRHLTEPVAGGSVKLTHLGLDALDEYRARAAGMTDEALRGALATLLSQRDALAEGFVPPEGCWRGEKPYLRQTHRLLADPTSALPWQPMVLHRGGWPDGS